MTQLRVPLSQSTIVISHTRRPVQSRTGSKPPSMNDVLGTVCCWSEQPERMRNILLQLPDIHDVAIEPKEKA